MNTPSKRIPGLDGLRALALFMVLGSHALLLKNGEEASGFWNEFLRHYIFNGHLGVLIFFVLSGFIITNNLVREINQTDTIDFKRFYINRFVKLVPPVVFLVGFVYFLSKFFGTDPFTPGCAAAALTFTVGVFSNCRWSMSHLWTLSCEEFFYLLWPFCLLFITPSRLRVKHLLFLVGACACYRGIYYKFPTLLPNPVWGVLGTLSNFDHMGIGAALALLTTQGKEIRWMERLASPRYLFLPVLLILATLYFANTKGVGSVLVLFGNTLRSVGFAWIMQIIIRDEVTWVGKLCRLRILSWIGLASYSIYILQQPIITRHLYTPFTNNLTLAAFISVGLSLALGSFLYVFLERPLQNLKNLWIAGRSLASSGSVNT